MILTMNTTAEHIRMQEEYKAKHSDSTIVLFRSGDVYKAYNDDAKRVSDATGCSISYEGETKIAEFPRQGLDINLPRLIRKGYRIAIIDG